MMKKNIFYLFTYLLLFLSGAGCSSNEAPQIPANKLPKDPTDQNLMEFNKGYVEFENKEINRYIDSLHLKMQTSDEGIRYIIRNEGKGSKFGKHDVATIRYTVSLLNGNKCPELTNVTKKISIGGGDVEHGFESAARMLRKGGSGDFIIPALVAYGVSGYKNCVPTWSPLYCKLSVIDINKKKK